MCAPNKLEASDGYGITEQAHRLLLLKVHADVSRVWLLGDAYRTRVRTGHRQGLENSVEQQVDVASVYMRTTLTCHRVLSACPLYNCIS